MRDIGSHHISSMRDQYSDQVSHNFLEDFASFSQILAAQTRSRLLNGAAKLGEGELRVPAQQDQEVQRTSSAATPRGIQVPAADTQQSPREPAEFLLRELPRTGRGWRTGVRRG